MRLALILAAAVAALATPALPLGAVERIMLQEKLAKHGYQVARRDGQIDVLTRIAIDGFARAHGIKADADSVWRYMVETSLRSQQRVQPGPLADAVRTAVGEMVEDPSRLWIRDLARKTDVDAPIVCGQMREWSTGPWRPFFGVTDPDGTLFILTTIDRPDGPPVAAMICVAAIPRQ